MKNFTGFATVATLIVIGLLAHMLSDPDIPNNPTFIVGAGFFVGSVWVAVMWFASHAYYLKELNRANADYFKLGAQISEWEDEHTIPLTRELVRKILERAHAFEWTLQGFGMLRLHLGRYGRIHIWDPRYKFEGASEIHDHFWPLKSRIISGRVVNHRYSVVANPTVPTHFCQTIVTGEGGGPAAEPIPCELIEESAFEYEAGEWYDQEPEDVHRTEADPGTVTLMARPMGKPGDVEKARSFYPIGTVWGTAEPRRATDEEVEDITKYALRHWRV